MEAAEVRTRDLRQMSIQLRTRSPLRTHLVFESGGEAHHSCWVYLIEWRLAVTRERWQPGLACPRAKPSFWLGFGFGCPTYQRLDWPLDWIRGSPGGLPFSETLRRGTGKPEETELELLLGRVPDATRNSGK